MIVLLSDFGQSEYVGVMHGVIATLSPASRVVDLTHSIDPQSIREAAWVLLKTYRYFPTGSVFVSVVDPGVGTKRDAVLVETNNYVHIGPDNGLVYPAASDDGIRTVYRIRIPADTSGTFHGRDVFARAGGILDAGQRERLDLEKKDRLDVEMAFYQEGRSGEVVRIDRFGNVITNIPALEKDEYRVRAEGVEAKMGLFKSYGYGPREGVFLVVGSYGTLEIAARNAAAGGMLTLRPGDRITIE